MFVTGKISIFEQFFNQQIVRIVQKYYVDQPPCCHMYLWGTITAIVEN